MNTQNPNQGGDTQANPAEDADFASFEAWREGKALDTGNKTGQDVIADQSKTGEPGNSATRESEQDDDDGQIDGQDAGKPQKGVQRRIDKLTRAKHDLEADREYWRQQTLLLQQQMLGNQGGKDQGAGKQPEKEVDPNKPRLHQFDTTEEYAEALTEYKLQKFEQQKFEQQQTQNAHKAAMRAEGQKIYETWMGRVEQARTRYEDFADVEAQLENIQIPLHLQQALSVSEVGPDIVYEVVKNPQLVEQIAKSPMAIQLMLLGQVEGTIKARLASRQDQDTHNPTVSRAPAPIQPVKGQSTRTEKSPDDMSQAEFEAWRDKQLNRR